MKKILLLIFTLSLVLMSCGAPLSPTEQNEITTTDQNESMTLAEPDFIPPITYEPPAFSRLFYNVERLAWDQKFVILEKPTQAEFKFDSKAYVGNYEKSIIFENGFSLDIYEFEGGDFSICEDDNSFRLSTTWRSPIASYPFDQLNENNCKNWLEQYLKTNIPEFNIDLYSYSCQTRLKVEMDYYGAPATTYATYDGFHVAKASQEVVNYTFDYKMNVAGFPTLNSVRVQIDEKGNIIHIDYEHHHADWTTVDIDTIDFLRIEKYIYEWYGRHYTIESIYYFFDSTKETIRLNVRITTDSDVFVAIVY